MDSSPKPRRPKLASKADSLARIYELHNDIVAATQTAIENTPVVEIGDVMPDGTIYGGESPTRHVPMYVAPADAPLMLSFNEAAEYTCALQVGDKQDFIIPDIEELKVLFDNRDKGALKGTFNETGTYPRGWYLSFTSPGDESMTTFRFNPEGYPSKFSKTIACSLRCIR